MKRIFLLDLFFVLLFPLIGRAEDKNYTVDSNGNVVFSIIIEDLPLNKGQIYGAARKYIENAYKDTSYEIYYNDAEKGVVIGKGVFTSLYEAANLTTAYIYNINFMLRADAMDGRARLQFIVKHYEVSTLSDIYDDKTEIVDIRSVAPIAENKQNRKHYQKAFEKLAKLADKTLKAISTDIKSTPSPVSISDDW